MEGRQEGMEKRGTEPTLEILRGHVNVLKKSNTWIDNHQGTPSAFLSTLFLPGQVPKLTWQWVGEPDQPFPGHQLQLPLPLDLVQPQVDA